MINVNAEVTLDRKKSLDKDYFARKYNKFAREVQKSLVLETIRFFKYGYKQSAKKRVKKEFARYKWRY